MQRGKIMVYMVGAYDHRIETTQFCLLDDRGSKAEHPAHMPRCGVYQALAAMIQPLFGAEDDEWVTLVGRYVLNMGAVEMATRLLIERVTGSDQDPVFSAALAARIGFLRKRFPRENATRHSWAMNVFAVALRHTTFRNTVAHSPLAISGQLDGSFKINGILNVTPEDPVNVGNLVSLEELKGRANESATIARDLLGMQAEYVAHNG